MPSLNDLLQASSEMHRHLCPRQVLGVRMGLLAGRELGLALPQSDKRVLTIVETDGCFADGVSVATGCWVGRRTLRVEDLGKAAATFVDMQTGRAFRIAPRTQARAAARSHAPEARNKWEAQLLGYQRMSDLELLAIQPVRLKISIERLVSRPGHRVVCQACGEDIINEREIVHEDTLLCRACLGRAYYAPCETPLVELTL